jgi:hypothetical protein
MEMIFVYVLAKKYLFYFSKVGSWQKYFIKLIPAAAFSFANNKCDYLPAWRQFGLFIVITNRIPFVTCRPSKCNSYY